MKWLLRLKHPEVLAPKSINLPQQSGGGEVRGQGNLAEFSKPGGHCSGPFLDVF